MAKELKSELVNNKVLNYTISQTPTLDLIFSRVYLFATFKYI